MSFWDSEIGTLTGNADDAFIKSFSLIPDGTTALAKIKEFKNDSFGSDKFYKIEWVLMEGDFKGQHVFQKLKTFDEKPKTRHQALNMMMLIYKMFEIKPRDAEPPTDHDLRAFFDKIAGIKIQETKPNDEGKQYNYVSEIHPKDGFKSATGTRKIVSPIVSHTPGNPLDSAMSRNPRVPEFDADDLPF